MRKKIYTEDCGKCDFMEMGDKNSSDTCTSLCTWGKSKCKKVLMDPVSKKSLKCKLKK